LTCVILIPTLYAQEERIESVTSSANPLVKDVRRALARGGLTDDGCCIAEGFHLLEEARRSGLEIPIVFVSESVSVFPEYPGTRTVRLPEALFNKISSTVTTQGVIALVRPPAWCIDDIFTDPALVVVLDGVQDPGNAGAIARAAEAFAATGIIFLRGSVTPLNPKTLRASAGSLFRVPFLSCPDSTVPGSHDIRYYAAMPFTGNERLAGEADFTQPCAIVIGSEGRGIGSELRALSQAVAIPTSNVESLNAAVAAAILLYEARKQRR
jgi:RNA methyltransferase, TrmH family